MGRRADRWRGALVAVVFLLCVCCLLMAMVATDAARLGPGATETDNLATSSPAKYSGSKATGADAFRSSKRRIPRGPDPFTTGVPRRRWRRGGETSRWRRQSN